MTAVSDSRSRHCGAATEGGCSELHREREQASQKSLGVGMELAEDHAEEKRYY